MGKKEAWIISEKDNVATVLSPAAEEGDTVRVFGIEPVREVVAKARIPYGHKIAVADIPKGSPVIKYGEEIGKATEPIQVGDYVHVHNIEGSYGRGDLVKVS